MTRASVNAKCKYIVLMLYVSIHSTPRFLLVNVSLYIVNIFQLLFIFRRVQDEA